MVMLNTTGLSLLQGDATEGAVFSLHSTFIKISILRARADQIATRRTPQPLILPSS
jgi:hypothetical protein